MGHIILVEGADMAKDTRNRILEASLELFAKNGYAATNVKDISDAVGIV
ncbi:MAG: TetR family transcriptional regulator [Eubacterium sp.]|nr:TetR family transcriptional regulator [Eubacterium sp.]